MKKLDGELKRLNFKVVLYEADPIEGDREFDAPVLEGGFGVFVPKGGFLQMDAAEADSISEGVGDVLQRWIKPKFND